MTQATHRSRAFLTAVHDIADQVATPSADEVDREARFPHETLAALRTVGGLSAFVPRSHGGEEVPLAEIAWACFELARGCGAAGMIYAMHQIQVASIVRHGVGSPFFDEYLSDLAMDDRLIASVTSEVGVSGDLRSSIAAATQDGDSLVFEKKAPTVSYGAYADDLLVTLRRASDADRSDQILALTRQGEMSLEQTSGWDSLGMRGTCSPGFVLRGRITPDHILPRPFADIATLTMVPVTHLLWAHVWLGIATDAYGRAHDFVRGQARKVPGTVPPAATRLSSLATELNAMRVEIAAATEEYADMVEADLGLDDGFTWSYAIRINTLKISASEHAVGICQGALTICGIAGYKNDHPLSVGRNFRDALSAPLMISNDRIHATNAALLLVQKDRLASRPRWRQ